MGWGSVVVTVTGVIKGVQRGLTEHGVGRGVGVAGAVQDRMLAGNETASVRGTADSCSAPRLSTTVIVSSSSSSSWVETVTIGRLTDRRIIVTPPTRWKRYTA